MPQHDAIDTYRRQLDGQRTLAMHGDTPSIRAAAMVEIHRLTAKIRALEARG